MLFFDLINIYICNHVLSAGMSSQKMEAEFEHMVQEYSEQKETRKLKFN